MSVNTHKILVTGASGQLGLALREIRVSHTELDFIFATKQELDITNMEAVSQYVAQHKPDVIINTAAYTAVDMAENEPEQAFLINEKGVENLALACKSSQICLIHISTDYVFDGHRKIPYTETDAVNPQTVYGKSKLAGEQAIQRIAPETYFIIRTSWLYSKNGHNFYNTMLRLAQEGKEISVVNDQWGSPTLANDLAQVLIHMAATGDVSQNGIYHYSGGGECTWYAFAKAILDKHYPNQYKLKGVSTIEYPTAAKRPRYSVLNKSLIRNSYGVNINNWKLMF